VSTFVRDSITCPTTDVPDTSTYDYDDVLRLTVQRDPLGRATGSRDDNGKLPRDVHQQQFNFWWQDY
jgi:hypothetical protein